MLKIENISFSFPNRPIFKELNLEVSSGQLVNLKGSNGAGKSTLLSLIAGLLSPDEGEVYWVESGQKQDDRRPFLEYLPPESNAMYTKMSAVANLSYWYRLRGLNPEFSMIKKNLSEWGLDQPLLLTDFAVEKFSTGMKRRLALARLCSSPARCWILDEPLYGLDVNAVGLFREKIRAHIQNGGCGLLVSHELEPFQDLITQTVNIGS